MTTSAPSSIVPSTGTGAVRKPSTSVRPSNWMGTKRPGISAGRAERRADRAARVVDGDAGVDVGGGDGERRLEFLECFERREALAGISPGGDWWRGRATTVSIGRNRRTW